SATPTTSPPTLECDAATRKLCRGCNRGTRNLTTHGCRSTLRGNVRWRLGVALRWQHDADDRLVRIHVGDGNVDARRLDDVDGVDADARSDMARAWRRRSSPCGS